jgi:hypothetical protein
MTRAITTCGWALLLASTMYAQNPASRMRNSPGGGPSPTPTATTPVPSATAPAAPVPANSAAGLTPAQSPFTPTGPPPSMLEQPPREAQIVIAGNSLSIHADNSSLAAILHQIAEKSGMKVEGLGGDERVFGSFGPGAPRDVLADLLDGTAYNLVLLGDLSDGVPRELILSPATRGGTAVAAAAPQANAEDASNEQETADVPPPPTPDVPPPGTTPAANPGVKSPQQLFEQLQRMRQAQQQQQQQPVQQDSPLQ